MKIIGITSTSVLALALGIATPVYAQHDQQGEKQDHHEQQQDRHEQAKPEPQHEQRQRQSEPPQHAQQQRQSEHSQPRAQQDRQDRPQHDQQQTRQDRPAQQEHAQRQRQDQTDRSHAQQSSRNTETRQRAQPQRQDHPQHPQQERNAGRRSPEQQRVQQTAWRHHGSQHWESEHRTWEQRGGYHGYRIPDDRFRGYFGSNHGFRINGLPFLVVRGYPRFQYQGYWFSPVDPWPEYWGSNWYDNDEVYVAYVDNGYYMYNRRYPTMGIAINISM